LTAHLVKPDAQIDDKMLARICEELHARFGIDHSTIQLETGDALCRQESHQTV
jgi:cobalt-zinc-cadmium efflux system protein